MFICTLKASNIKFFALVFSAVALLVALVLITRGGASDALEALAAPEADKVSFENVRSNEDRIAFLRQFGWDVESEPVSEIRLKLPAEFNGIMNEYNEIQKSQGLDLSKYKGNEVVRYSYRVTNYPGYDGEVIANVIVANSRVVAGDVCSADPDGFIGSLYMPEVEARTKGVESETPGAASTLTTEDVSADGTFDAPAKQASADGTVDAPAEQANADGTLDAPAEQVDAEAPWDGTPEIADAAYSG